MRFNGGEYRRCRGGCARALSGAPGVYFVHSKNLALRLSYHRELHPTRRVTTVGVTTSYINSPNNQQGSGAQSYRKIADHTVVVCRQTIPLSLSVPHLCVPVQSFPNGYNTGVGDGGFQLSGGQKQVNV